MIKRSFDVLLSVVLICLTAPLHLLTAVLVATDLGRPVLFYQLRKGRNDSIFRLVKFRSMRPQPTDGRILDDAARVTPGGVFIRRFRLDELPQLVLILSGQMSLVGPRPLFPFGHAPENDRLFRYRHRVRPGMTGWAQVNGNTLLSEREKLALDAVYVSRTSIHFDFWILWLTFLTILRGERRHEGNIEGALRHADRINRSG
jgi:lipopolysaccharide/colanic/teichoic acid biosynthesis glycosyltransferase